jgi:hypothetical protein
MGVPSVFPQHKLRQNNGNAPVDFDTDTIKVTIRTASYIYSSGHAFLADLGSNEVSGAGYAAGGAAVANKTMVLDGDNAEFAHDDLTFAQNAGGFTNGRVFIWYKDTGNPATSPLIMRMAEASDFGTVAGDVILDGSAATGVLNWT